MNDVHDYIVKELFEKKSVAALIYLVDCGRELEFTVDDAKCFISKSNSKRYVSLWGNQAEQAFDHPDILAEQATIGQDDFLTAWAKATLDTLF